MRARRHDRHARAAGRAPDRGGLNDPPQGSGGDEHDDELAELARALRAEARPGERLLDTHRRLTEESLERRRRYFLLERIVDDLPVNIFAKDSEHRYLLANRNVSGLAGRSRDEVLGRTDFEVLPEAAARKIRASDERARAAHGLQLEELEVARGDGRTIQLLVGKILVQFAEDSEPVLLGFALDISERKRFEDELRRQLVVSEAQREVITRLSAPIIEVWERVVLVPIFGALGRERAGALLEAVLTAVQRKQARFVVVDMTGVDVTGGEATDADTAMHLATLLGAVRLLGADAIVTGIRPAVAHTLVELGLDLGRVTTLANLRDGLRHCIRRMDERRGRP